MVLPRSRVVLTGSGARAVQVLWSYRGGKLVLDHVGSAHSDEELFLLKAQAQALIDGDQQVLPLGGDCLGGRGRGLPGEPLPVIAERAGYLVDAIASVYADLGFEQASGGDGVFADLVMARLIQPGSKLDSIETLAEVGVKSVSYSTIKRRLPVYATEEFRDALTMACVKHAGVGPGVLVLYDVTTLYFETDTPDELRKSGFSKERRLEPQITVGLLADAAGFPLAVGAFEGNMAETRTMVPMIQRFCSTYDVGAVTIVADAGMFSASNKQAIIESGLDYILGVKFKYLPYPVDKWRQDNPGREYTDKQIWSIADRSGRGPAGQAHSITYYQYSNDRARRTLKGIDEQVAKAVKAVAGQIAIKHNRYVDLQAPGKRVNHELADKNRALAGIKGYETSRTDLHASEVIACYRQLLRIEKTFRMSKSDLKARPIYHHTAQSIDAHLTIVMAALAVGHELEKRTGISLKRLIRILKRYRTFQLEISGQTIHAATPLPPEIQQLITKIQKPD